VIVRKQYIWTITDVFLLLSWFFHEKVQEAFASKMRLLKKIQNHNQRATCYENLNTRLDQQRGKSSKSSTHAKRPNSLDQEFNESEWGLFRYITMCVH
jgi:DNA-binding transcriptional regulator GbsR (MarR family)